jgi:hypothetical protein
VSTTHVAGPTITVAGRKIQRCSVCGEKLCDSLNVAMPVGPGGEEPTFPTWETGRLVRVTDGNPRSEVLLADTDRLPDDSCIDLVE